MQKVILAILDGVGYKKELYFIDKIIDIDGKIIYKHKDEKNYCTFNFAFYVSEPCSLR